MTNNNPTNNLTAYINSLCDIVPDKKRKLEHFVSLLDCLEKSPKECTPFKGKILQHIQVHALGNPDVNLELLSLCLAKATILFRKGTNKSEDSLGAWKVGLTNELKNLEKNINELYQLVRVNVQNVVDYTANGNAGNSTSLVEAEDLKTSEKLNESRKDYQIVINDYLLRVNWAASNICALISIKTDFSLTIPVQVLLKLASKIGALRWPDYKISPSTLVRSHVYSLTPYLIDVCLMIFKSTVTVLGSNIIPYSSFINQSVMRMLEWTRSSHLEKSDENLYHRLRSQLFEHISFLIEQLSLNFNLEPALLKTLIEVEIVDELDVLLQATNETSGANLKSKNLHLMSALKCLENLFIIYAKYLEAPLEVKIKNYIIQCCIKIYRDLESNVINLECRRQLLNLLVIIANQPFATSTTEISYHIFELIAKHEHDLQMKNVARRCLKVGLAHRPTIVSQYDVYTNYNGPMLPIEELPAANGQVNGLNETKVDELKGQVDVIVESDVEVENDGGVMVENKNEGDDDEEDEVEVIKEVRFETSSESIQAPANASSEATVNDKRFEPPAQTENLQSKQQQVPEDESEILSYMSHFVEKLA